MQYTNFGFWFPEIAPWGVYLCNSGVSLAHEMILMIKLINQVKRGSYEYLINTNVPSRTFNFLISHLLTICK